MLCPESSQEAQRHCAIALLINHMCVEVWVFLCMCVDVLSRNISQSDQIHGK